MEIFKCVLLVLTVKLAVAPLLRMALSDFGQGGGWGWLARNTYQHSLTSPIPSKD